MERQSKALEAALGLRREGFARRYVGILVRKSKTSLLLVPAFSSAYAFTPTGALRGPWLSCPGGRPPNRTDTAGSVSSRHSFHLGTVSHRSAILPITAQSSSVVVGGLTPVSKGKGTHRPCSKVGVGVSD